MGIVKEGDVGDNDLTVGPGAKACDVLDAAVSRYHNGDSTHYPDCWNYHPGCAVALLRSRLQAAEKALNEIVAIEHHDEDPEVSHHWQEDMTDPGCPGCIALEALAAWKEQG